MANLWPVVWMVLVTIAVEIPAVEVDDFGLSPLDDFGLSPPDRNGFPSTNFVPKKIKIVNEVYDNLLDKLSDELSAEGIRVDDYFPKDVESDEQDELDFVQEYEDEDNDEDEDHLFDGYTLNISNDGSLNPVGRKEEVEFSFTKELTIYENGTRTFDKYYESEKTGSTATSTATGSYNTSFDVSSSLSGTYEVQKTHVPKSAHRTVVARGTVNSSSSSKSKIKNRRLLERTSTDMTLVFQTPVFYHMNGSMLSESETLRLPFKSYLKLSRSRNNITLGALTLKSKSAEEVFSHVATANKTVSLTKEYVKEYVKTRYVNSNSANKDGHGHVGFDVELTRGQTYTWTKVLAESKTEVVVDVITCKKTKTYGKTIKKGEYVEYTGSGKISWEKSRFTVAAERLRRPSLNQHGIDFTKKQLKIGSFFPF